MGATSGPGSVVNKVKAAPLSGIGRHNPAKQNQSPPIFVNRHFVFGDFLPVNSQKNDTDMRHRPTGNLRPSDRKLMTGGPFARPGGKPQRRTVNSLIPSSSRRIKVHIDATTADVHAECIKCVPTDPGNQNRTLHTGPSRNLELGCSFEVGLAASMSELRRNVRIARLRGQGHAGDEQQRYRICTGQPAAGTIISRECRPA
jgi:hypothetical protein